MRHINEHEAGRMAYMMNEKNKSLENPGIKTEGIKKASHGGEVGKQGWLNFILSWLISGSAYRGLE